MDELWLSEALKQTHQRKKNPKTCFSNKLIYPQRSNMSPASINTTKIYLPSSPATHMYWILPGVSSNVSG